MREAPGPGPVRCLTVVACALLAACPSVVRAQAGPPLSLTWDAPAGCPSEPEIVADALRLAGAVTASRHVRAVATVEQRDAGHRAIVAVDGGPERTIAADDCAQAGRAVALILAVALSPGDASAPPSPRTDGARSASEAEPAPAGSSSAAHSPVPRTRAPADSSPAAHSPVPRDRGAIAWLARLEGVAEVGTLPEPGVGVAAAVGARLGPVRIELAGRYLLPSNAELRARADAGGRIDLVVAGLTGCLAPSSGALAYGGCAGLDVGAMRGRGYGVSDPQPATAPWLAVRAGGFVTGRLGGPFSVRLTVDLLGQLLRPAAVLEPYGQVFRPSPLGARAALGLELSLE